MRLAVPAVLAHLATMFMGIVDTLMVARLGTEALAAVTLGSIWVFGTLVLGMGVLFGLDPIVAQAHGAGDGGRAGLALQRGLVLSALLSLPLGGLWLYTGSFLRLAGQLPALCQLVHTYTLVQIGSIPLFLAFTVLRQYLAGRGIMAPAMWILWAANALNVFLCWVLIFGHLGFPRLGVVGSGIATAIARGVMFLALALWIVLAKLHHGAWSGWSKKAFDRAGLAEVLHYGLPVGAQLGLEVWSFHVVAFMAGIIGTTALAAHAIVLNLAAFTFMVPLGISTAAATRVGNLSGAGDRPGARRAAGLALIMGAGVMAVSATAFLLLRHLLPALWQPAPAVYALASSILPIAAAFQIFDGTQVVGCGALRGVGDTRPAAWFNLLGYYGLGLPLGYYFAFHLGMGLPGLWWGLVIGLMTVAALLVWRVQRRI